MESSEEPRHPPRLADDGLPTLRTLLADLRRAIKDGEESVVRQVEMSAARITVDAAYADALRQEVRDLLTATRSTHLLTEVGILSEEGLYSGIVRRLAARFAPMPTDWQDLEGVLATLIGRADEAWIRAVEPAILQSWLHALLGDRLPGWDDPSEIASAQVILATRIAGAGLNARLVERMSELDRWSSPFLELARAVNHHAELLVQGTLDTANVRATVAIVDQCMAQVESFRESKNELGTTIELSSHTLRMQQQLRRLRLMLEMGSDADAAWSRATASLIIQLLLAQARHLHVRDFAREKIGLWAYLAVGHAAKKGASYAAHTAAEYRKFLNKSLLGGFLVAIFACFKNHLSHEGLAPLPQGLLYGLNYALCFALIYLFGATLATKQPAMTASRLARSLEGADQGQGFAVLVRAIWRSQFISFVGNVLGAAVFTVLFAMLFLELMGTPLVTEPEAAYLLASLHPTESLSLYYAAIAGVMLSSAGFLAGWVDNTVVFHRVARRIAAGTGIFALVPRFVRQRMAARVDAQLGGLTGNIVLGFMLGIAGTIGYITGLAFDIRHVAFASSHATLGLVTLPDLQTAAWIAIMLGAVLLIGLVNFLVSFGITLTVAIQSGRLEGVDWPAAIRSVLALIMRQPIRFFIPWADTEPSDPGDKVVTDPGQTRKRGAGS